MDRASAKRTASARGSFGSSKLFGYDFFISFKLGNPPGGAQSYASDLARGLRELDYTVFFSEEEASPGQQLNPTLMRALRRARALVVVATPGALASPWVRKEVETFRADHPDRPVIPIDVDDAVATSAKSSDAASWLGCADDRIWLDDSAQAIRDGIVTTDIFTRLALVPRFLHANRLFRSLVSAVIVGLIGLAGFAWLKREESHNRLVAYNLAQGRVALASGRALEAAPSLLRAFKEGEDTPALRFMLARAFASPDAQVATFDAEALAFAPDGTRFAVALRNGSINVWSAPALQVVATLQANVPDVLALAFSPDGTRLLVTAWPSHEPDDADDEDCQLGARAIRVVVSLWDAGSGALLHEVQPPGMRGGCWLASFAGGGKTVAVAGWSTQRTDLYWWATTYDARDFRPLATTSTDSDQHCRQVAVAPTEVDSTGECSGKVVGVSADGGRLAIAPWDMPQRELTIWSPGDGSARSLSFGRDTEIVGVDFSLDGGRVAITLPDGIEIWDLTTFARLRSLAADAQWVPAAFSPDGTRLVAVTGERGAAVFDAGSGQRTALLAGHSARVRVATFSPDSNQVLTAGDDGLVKLSDGWTGRLLSVLEGHRTPVVDVGFSLNRRWMFSRGRNERVRLWEVRLAGETRTLREDPARMHWWGRAPFELVDWSVDGARVLLKHEDEWTAFKGEAVFSEWDVGEGVLTRSWRSAEAPVSLGGRPAAGGDGGSAKVAPCPADEAWRPPDDFVADPTGDHVLWLDRIDSSRAGLLRSKSQHCRTKRLEGHKATILAAAFSSDGALLLTADDDGVVMVWETASGLLLAALNGERGPAAAQFLPGGRAITVDDHLTAVVWDVAREERSIAELERVLACDGGLAGEALADLTPPGGPVDCRPVPRTPAASRSDADALWASGWAWRNDPAWAAARLSEAATVYRASGDVYGQITSALALRSLARAADDAAGAEARADTIRELVLRLRDDDAQRARLTQLGETAFNELGDTEMARFVFARALERTPGFPGAMLSERETALVGPRHDDDATRYESSQRWLVQLWVAKVLAGSDAAGAAFDLWNMYEGTTIDPIFERLDFRGLRRELLAAAAVARQKRDRILPVLETLEHPGRQGDRVKSLLGVPKEAQTVGP